MTRFLRFAIAAASLFVSTAALAAIPFAPIVAPNVPNGQFNAFPTQNPLGPTGLAQQSAYPYPGQCVADPLNAAMFPLLSQCTGTTSFSCVGTSSPRSAGDWVACGAPVGYVAQNPILPWTVPPAGTPATLKFRFQVLNPPDYTPDTATFPGAHYYEIQLHEAWGFQQLANAALFPNPIAAGLTTVGVPNGMQWTGLVCNLVAGCACPADASASFRTSFCTGAGGKIPMGKPLFTPIWGIGSAKNGFTMAALAGLGLGGTAGPATPWSANDFLATWPSISIRGKRGTPVVVKWVNEFPNNHVLCPHPEAADWPCGIDRTFMGVKARIDPASAQGTAVPPDGVNIYGSPQQPDNSWVTHLHGGEIPPATDGFAEKWFGNTTTADKYANVNGYYLNPPFEPPFASSLEALKRPAGNADTYTYPMVQDEATIWFHDHTLGKTHHNVIAGPAGFFPVKDPAKHNLRDVLGACPAGQGACDYTWLDPVTEPRGALGIPAYDLFFAIQDRAFNEDGSINFSNGLGQVLPAGKGVVLPAGYSSVTPGANPLVHPTWVPEYFGDHVLVNGVLWPYKDVAAGWYRIRMVDGSDSRCWTIGLSSVLPAPGTKPANNVPFWVLANDQGYLQAPVPAPGNQFTMCPGERYELLVNFAGLANVYMTNSAPAPFPAGITPFATGSPFAEMNTVMRFVVGGPTAPAPILSCAAGIIPGTAAAANCMPANPALQTDPNFVDIRPLMPFAPGTVVRQVYLNERVDGITQSPFGMQLNGVPFEYKVTETPVKGTREVWQFVNLTVDAHPMHPHLVKHQIVARQPFNVGAYKAALCGSATCQPGTVPGGEMQAVPDVTPFLGSKPTLVTAASVEGGWKDASQAPPGLVTTIVADWVARWPAVGAPTAPGTAGCPTGTTGCAAPYVFEDVTTGPYVWHCHINSHEDSEMMRTSLVVSPTKVR